MEDPAWPELAARFAGAENARVIPISRPAGPKVLNRLQVTARSTLGALALNCGGVILDHGWLRNSAVVAKGCGRRPTPPSSRSRRRAASHPAASSWHSTSSAGSLRSTAEIFVRGRRGRILGARCPRVRGHWNRTRSLRRLGARWHRRVLRRLSMAGLARREQSRPTRSGTVDLPTAVHQRRTRHRRSQPARDFVP